MEKKKISILSHNLSENCLGRAYILAKVLANEFEVEIIGPVQKSGIWVPVRNDIFIVYKQIENFNPFTVLKAIDGDIIYAIKPLFTSFGFGLLCKILKHKKIIIDIDDWEVGFYKNYSLPGRIVNVFRFWDFNNFLFTWIMEKMIPFADFVTVSNSFLQNKFGGVIIPHFRDTEAFDPSKFNREISRKNLNIEQDKKVVMFLGTVRKHKGIDTLISTFDSLKRNDVILALVGVDDAAAKELPQRNYLRVFGPQPFEKIPEFLAVADVVAIIQKQSSLSNQGQLPAKLFDAMSMGKPVISTNISDIPAVLDGCGIIINDNVDELIKAINSILENPEYARKLGVAARQRCIEKYSYEAIRPKLLSIFSNIKL